MGSDPQLTILMLVIVFGSISLHEFGHAKSADSAGDPTPRSMGRVTLNPMAHFDPVGFIMIIVTSITGFGIGWGKPVMINQSKMQNPRWDGFMATLWGPLTNVIIAVVFALIFRLTPLVSGDLPIFTSQGVVGVSLPNAFAFWAVILNVSLALFNLIPLGPLDGGWLLGALLPQPLGARYIAWNRSVGMLVFLGVILADSFLFRNSAGIIGTLIQKPAMFVVSHLLGL